MIGKLRELLREISAVAAPDEAADRVPLAMAALLVEAARADHQISDVELAELAKLLTARLGLDAAAAQNLVDRARAAVEKSVSLHEFTRPLHEALDYGQKEDFVRMLWRVAVADRRLDKYEDYLIGKVAELLYVSRGDVLRLKHEVLQESPAATGGD